VFVDQASNKDVWKNQYLRSDTADKVGDGGEQTSSGVELELVLVVRNALDCFESLDQINSVDTRITIERSNQEK
jgi:hypothetical protein